MGDESDEAQQRLYEDAVKSYLEHRAAGEVAGEARMPDRAKSLVKSGPDPSVILRDHGGTPLGSVAWFSGSEAVFEPPTKITLVDLFHGLRPKKPG